MTADTRIRRIFDLWHEAAIACDPDAMAALYADDAILESPLVLMSLPDRANGVLKGRAAIRSFLAGAFANAGNGLGRWYRTGSYFTDGSRLVWEYPRQTPEGDQIDLVEVMETANGLITHHRVYWGWVGVGTLTAMNASRRAELVDR